jgi:hypothetical protein
MTKRIGYKFEDVCSIENIERAGLKAAKDKGSHKDVQYYKKHREELNKELQRMLLDKTYNVSKHDYKVFFKKTASGKVREIHKLDFFPYRVAQHAILQIMQERWIKSLNNDVYNCLPGYGINSRNLVHNFTHKLKRALLDSYSVYALKCDIRQFYPSVDNRVYAKCYRHELKDKNLIWLLDVHNFSNKGLPIGGPDSQLGSHLVLRKIDRYIKEELKAKYYFRYADDLLILSNSKKELHQWMWRIRNYLYYELKLEIKSDRRVFPVAEGIDMCGYVFYPGYTKLRKRTKKAMVKRRHKPQSMASYNGILKYCDSNNLIKKVIKENNIHMKINEFNIKIERPFDGDLIKIEKLVDETIDILDFEVRESTKNVGHYWIRMQVTYRGTKRFVKGGFDYIATFLRKVEEKMYKGRELTAAEKKVIKKQFLPITDVIIKSNRGYYFEGTLN